MKGFLLHFISAVLTADTLYTVWDFNKMKLPVVVVATCALFLYAHGVQIITSPSGLIRYAVGDGMYIDYTTVA